MFIRVFLLIILVPCLAQALTLDNALKAAYENNPKIKAERSALKQLDEDYFKAFGRYLPEASLSQSRGVNSVKRKQQKWQGSGIDRRSADVTLNVFNGGGDFSRVRQALKIIDSGRQALKKIEQEVLLEAVSAYTNVALSKEIMLSAENNYKAQYEFFRITQAKFKYGSNSITDVTQTEASLAKAESELIKAKGEYEKSQGNFLKVIGVKAVEVDGIEYIKNNVKPDFKDLSEAIIAATNNNADLKAAEYTKEANKYNIHAARSKLLPTIDISGSYGLFKDSKSNINNSLSAEGLVTVTIPIYQQGIEYADARKARHVYKKSVYDAQDLKETTIHQVNSTWYNIKTFESVIIVGAKEVLAAETAAKGAKLEEEVGTKSNIDVLLAQQNLYEARIRKLEAVNNYIIENFNLKLLTGNLTAEKLQLKVDVYDPATHFKSTTYKFIGL